MQTRYCNITFKFFWNENIEQEKLPYKINFSPKNLATFYN